MISPEKIAEMLAAAEQAYDRVKEWPEARMRAGAVEELGPGFTDLLLLRNLVPDLLAVIRSELITLRTERDEARELVTEANNSLYGSQGYFHSLNGGPFDKYHLANGIEKLKETSRAEWRRAEAAEAQLARHGDMEKHFVEFFSPGTFVAESSVKPIDTWDVETAVLMATEVKERHGAVPYGFRFLTRSRGPDDLDSNVAAKSGMYYLGGRVETLEQVKARNDPKDRILISNMECNGYSRIVTNDNSWPWTQPLHDGDVVLSSEPHHG